MSCHVMSCRHYCIDSHKYILETFISIKYFIKHFAGIFTRTRCAPQGDNKCNDEKNIVITREWNDRSNLFYVDCHASLCSARNDEKSKSRNDKCNDEKSKSCNDKSFCNDKNFQFDKYWRLFFKNELFLNELFSVIYKKNLLIWRFCL